MDIVRLTPEQMLNLRDALNDAIDRDRSVRICTATEEDGTWVKWDSGYGWTPPFYGLDW